MSKKLSSKKKSKPNNQVIEKEPELVRERENQAKPSVIQASRSFAGPIPDPETLSKYAQSDPKIVDWILNASDKEREHRHEMDRSVTQSHFNEARVGQICAVISVLAVMATSAFMASKGQSIGASILGVGGLATIVGIFIYGRGKQNTSDENDIENE